MREKETGCERGERDREGEAQILMMLLSSWLSTVPRIKLFSNENQGSNPTTFIFCEICFRKAVENFLEIRQRI